MEQCVFLLLLVLGMQSAVQGWTTAFCRGEPCPQYSLVDINEEFETRQYVRSRWITLNIHSRSNNDLMIAHQTLRAYCEGAELPMNTWPVLITLTEGEDGSESLSLSWFLEDDTVLPETNNLSIVEEFRPATTVYVKVFDTVVSYEDGKDNAEKLRKALAKAGKSVEEHKYTGAGFDYPWTYYLLHNEVWVYAA